MEMFDNIKIYKKMKPVDTFIRIGKTAAWSGGEIHDGCVSEQTNKTDIKRR
jgi:hypothetical protein